MSNYTDFGHGDKLRRFDYNASTGEKGPDSKTVSRSSVEVISLNTGVDGTYWEAGINSHCSFASTTPMQRHQILELSATRNFSSEIKLSDEVKTELQWWLQNRH